MQPEPIGQRVYNDDEEAWVVHLPLVRLAAYGTRTAPGQSPPDEAAMQRQRDHAAAALDRLMLEMRDKQATEKPPTYSNYDPFYSPGDKAAWDRRDARYDFDAAARKEGLFPVYLRDPRRAGVSPQQEAALRHLVEHETAVCDAVLRTLFEAYRYYFDGDYWQQFSPPRVEAPAGLTVVANLTQVDIPREFHRGVSYLVFPVDSDWEMEHGMNVVYHPAKPAAWGTSDELSDLVEPDQPGEQEPPAPNQALFEAVLVGDDARVQELVAQGHDINAVGTDAPWPPLCYAVQELDVDLVRRLLAVGADPGLKDYEGLTALGRARELLRERTPGPGDWLMRLFLGLARLLNRRVMADFDRRLRTIIRLLEAAEQGRA